jgi:hypothetical protein
MRRPPDTPTERAEEEDEGRTDFLVAMDRRLSRLEDLWLFDFSGRSKSSDRKRDPSSMGT